MIVWPTRLASRAFQSVDRIQLPETFWVFADLIQFTELALLLTTSKLGGPMTNRTV